MRTTVTLDPDVESLIQRAMHEKGITFKQAINEAIRAGLMSRSASAFQQPTFAMGFRPEINYDRALHIAAALDDEELVRKTALGKQLVVIVDANVLLYATNESMPRHADARRWVAAALNGREAVGFGWIVLLAFLRLSTLPALFPQPLQTTTALDVVDNWLSATPAALVHPTPRQATVLRGLLSGIGTAGNLVTDARVAALSIEHGASLCTFDRDFYRVSGLNVTSPNQTVYCESVRNITVTVDDDTYRRARVKAAEQSTSVSALVKRFLVELAADESDTERLRREERALRARITNFRAGDRMSREEAHARDF